jgi:hypothetical protein
MLPLPTLLPLQLPQLPQLPQLQHSRRESHKLLALLPRWKLLLLPTPPQTHGRHARPVASSARWPLLLVWTKPQTGGHL